MICLSCVASRLTLSFPFFGKCTTVVGGTVENGGKISVDPMGLLGPMVFLFFSFWVLDI